MNHWATGKSYIYFKYDLFTGFASGLTHKLKIFYYRIISLYSLTCTILGDEIAVCLNSSNLRFSVTHVISSLPLLHCTTYQQLSSSTIHLISAIHHNSDPTSCHLDSHLLTHTTHSFKSTKLLLFLMCIVSPCSLFSNGTFLKVTDFHLLFASVSTSPHLSCINITLSKP